ncbi:MAG: C2 family cysteine protease [Archangium sp.]
MPVSINDRKLSSLYTSYERAAKPLGKEQALEILSHLGDSARWGQVKLADQLKKPGMSTEQQIALAKDGITANEKKDLETILDKGQVPLEAGARAFLEQVLGRSPTTPVNPTPVEPQPTAITANGISVNANQTNGLSGTTRAGASIEAINISTAPGGRLHMDDTMVIGKADSNGKFDLAKLTGEQAMREGDLIRMRARYADGTTSDWVTVKASGLEAKDSRNAVVALFRIGMADAGNGKIDVTNINASRQVSEPGAKLQFTNNRTGEKTQVTVTAEGGFPAGFKLNGKAGDSFAIAASDGVNNTAFTEIVGNVTVPGGTPGNVDLIPDPALHKDELDSAGKPKFNTVRFTGPLFIDGPKADDVRQGQIGNCYFPAAMAAIAKSNPEAITNMVKDNGDGTYTVTFKQKDWATGRSKDVPVKVDGDLYARSYGGALYGHSSNSSDAKKMELWFPLVEKAYAQWKGSYNTIGNGGHVSDVFEDVLGVDASYQSLGYGSPDKAWNQIVANVDAGKAVGAGTYGEDREALYTNSGVYANHAYSILGYEKSGTDRFVILRNPWGESEPAGNGPNDGVFKLKLEDFTKLYQSLYYQN